MKDNTFMLGKPSEGKSKSEKIPLAELELIREVNEIFSNPGPDGHTHYSQRLGQKLINYVRFEALPAKYPEHVRKTDSGIDYDCTRDEFVKMIEHYIFNMSDTEFVQALQRR